MASANFVPLKMIGLFVFSFDFHYFCVIVNVHILVNWIRLRGLTAPAIPLCPVGMPE
jgi:hypothetical protein